MVRISRLKSRLGWILVPSIALLPCIYLLYLEQSAFSLNFNYLLRITGKLSALFGMSLFSMAFLLNTRLTFLEDLFGGLDKVYKAHRIFGTIAFVSLLAHPLLLASTYLSVSVAEAFRFLLPGNSLPLSLGVFGLLSMEIFLISTFFAKMKHQNWKFVHRLLGISFFLGALHTFLTPSAVTGNAAIRAYLLLIISVGSISYIYRTVLWTNLVKRHNYVIADVRQLSGSITELALSPEGAPMKFEPGQFIFISLVSGISSGESHPFTISSPSSERFLRMSIKSLGDFTSDMKNATPGTKVKIEGPYGRFCPQASGGGDQIWIAGGIGITPFLAIARSMNGSPDFLGSFKSWILGNTGAAPFLTMMQGSSIRRLRNIDMYYCAKNGEEAVFLDELNSISEKNKSLRVIPFFSADRGRITAEQISNITKGLGGKEIFICGPSAMMHALKSQFLAMGIPGSSIHTEEFEL